VADRPDPETASAIPSVGDPRVQLVLNPHPSTVAAARNAGVDHATGEWLAFLDDVDERLPNKLERQLAFAGGRALALLSCLSRVATPAATYVWPQAIYDNFDPIDGYLFHRGSLLTRAGFIPQGAVPQLAVDPGLLRPEDTVTPAAHLRNGVARSTEALAFKSNAYQR
jgi:glycosyltransferase involved in cell wall biosynthesis